jgi:hypothetical protein
MPRIVGTGITAKRQKRLEPILISTLIQRNRSNRRLAKWFDKVILILVQANSKLTLFTITTSSTDQQTTQKIISRLPLLHQLLLPGYTKYHQ